MSALYAAAVLVELFTSEGCSSCPPADAVLARLHQKQPAPDVQLVVLSEHVDYWNNLGWKDPFSDGQFSARQELYGSRIYTPQAVVDGRRELLGSDEAGIVRAAKAAALEPHGTVTCTNRTDRADRRTAAHLSVRDLPPHGRARVLVALLEDGVTSKVQQGENAGRTLQHTAVVRVLKEVAIIPASAREWAGDVEIPQDPAWKQTRLVAFVQDDASRHVLAAGTSP
jgi:hypothetical protein